jgi:hypothetical protein
LESDARLQPGERSPKAEMDPLAETELSALISSQLQLIRLCEPSGIAIGSAVDEKHSLAFRNDGTMDFDCFRGHPSERLDRRYESRQLLHGDPNP